MNYKLSINTISSKKKFAFFITKVIILLFVTFLQLSTLAASISLKNSNTLEKIYFFSQNSKNVKAKIFLSDTYDQSYIEKKVLPNKAIFILPFVTSLNPEIVNCTSSIPQKSIKIQYFPYLGTQENLGYTKIEVFLPYVKDLDFEVAGQNNVFHKSLEKVKPIENIIVTKLNGERKKFKILKKNPKNINVNLKGMGNLGAFQTQEKTSHQIEAEKFWEKIEPQLENSESKLQSYMNKDVAGQKPERENLYSWLLFLIMIIVVFILVKFTKRGYYKEQAGEKVKTAKADSELLKNIGNVNNFNAKVSMNEMEFFNLNDNKQTESELSNSFGELDTCEKETKNNFEQLIVYDKNLPVENQRNESLETKTLLKTEDDSYIADFLVNKIKSDLSCSDFNLFENRQIKNSDNFFSKIDEKLDFSKFEPQPVSLDNLKIDSRKELMKIFDTICSLVSEPALKDLGLEKKNNDINFDEKLKIDNLKIVASYSDKDLTLYLVNYLDNYILVSQINEKISVVKTFDFLYSKNLSFRFRNFVNKMKTFIINVNSQKFLAKMNNENLEIMYEI